MSIVFEMNETSLVNKVLGALSTFKYFVNFVRQVFAKFLNFFFENIFDGNQRIMNINAQEI